MTGQLPRVRDLEDAPTSAATHLLGDARFVRDARSVFVHQVRSLRQPHMGDLLLTVAVSAEETRSGGRFMGNE